MSEEKKSLAGHYMSHRVYDGIRRPSRAETNRYAAFVDDAFRRAEEKKKAEEPVPDAQMTEEGLSASPSRRSPKV